MFYYYSDYLLRKGNAETGQISPYRVVISCDRAFSNSAMKRSLFPFFFFLSSPRSPLVVWSRTRIDPGPESLKALSLSLLRREGSFISSKKKRKRKKGELLHCASTESSIDSFIDPKTVARANNTHAGWWRRRRHPLLFLPLLTTPRQGKSNTRSLEITHTYVSPKKRKRRKKNLPSQLPSPPIDKLHFFSFYLKSHPTVPPSSFNYRRRVPLKRRVLWGGRRTLSPLSVSGSFLY